jgi:hypothetical protein
MIRVVGRVWVVSMRGWKKSGALILISRFMRLCVLPMTIAAQVLDDPAKTPQN